MTGQKALGFSGLMARSHVNPATTSVGNQKIAVRYLMRDRLRMAERIALLLALATLLASAFSGQNIMLDILATIFFAAAIIARLAVGASKPKNA